MNEASEHLPSEQVILSAPMSFTGSTQRIYRSHLPRMAGSTGWSLAGSRALMITLMVLAWLGVVCWYAIFGLWLVPYRIVRRTQRKNERNELRHREMIRMINQTS